MFAILYPPPLQLNGRFWFGDTLCGEKFSKELKNVEDPRQFYNEVSSIKSKIKVSVFFMSVVPQMAENYEEVVRGWGYNMPEVKLFSYFDDSSNTKKN